MRNFLIALTLAVVAYSAAIAFGFEPWQSQGGGSKHQNANPTPVGDNIRIRWEQAFTGLHLTEHNDPKLGTRSNEVVCRDGKLVLIVPGEAPENFITASNGVRLYVPSIGVIDLTDGHEIKRVYSQTSGYSDCFHGGAYMGDDGGRGRRWTHLAANWDYADRWGGDLCSGPGRDQLNLLTGGRSLNPGLNIVRDSNAYSYYNQSDLDSRNYAWTGGGHSPFLMYCPVVLRDDMAAKIEALHKTSSTAWGTYISYSRLTPESTITNRTYQTIWRFRDDFIQPLGLINMNPCGGSPFPICWGDDGRIYFFGSRCKASAVAPYYQPDPASKMTLYGVRSATDLIQIPTSASGMLAFNTPSPRNYTVQMATIGPYVIVFAPQQRTNSFSPVIAAQMWCFNTVTRSIAWEKTWAVGAFQATTICTANELNKEQASQCVIAGDRVYVADPWVSGGKLALTVWQRTLAPGGSEVGQVITTSIPVTTTDSYGRPALRELAAIDGNLVTLVDYDRTSQALVCLRGDATPEIAYPPLPPAPPPPTYYTLRIKALPFTSNTPRGDHQWTPINATTVQAQPNNGYYVTSNIDTTAPKLAYAVTVPADGRYFVWIYGSADTAADDSVHVGFDGTAPVSGQNISGILGTTPKWSHYTVSGATPYLDLPAGDHEVELLMREDGAKIGGLLLTTDPYLVPSGAP